MVTPLFKELLQRKVFRGAGLYLVVAWLTMQVAEIVVPALRLPDWTLTFVVVVLALGFPIVVVLAWMFEVTPEGLKLDSDVDRSSRAPSGTGRAIDFAIIGVLTVVAGYFGWHYFSSPREPQATTTGEPSIAVLPFVNMSDDRSNDYFSDGVSEELLNALAKVQGLKVAGRTSSFYFKGRDQDLRLIAEQLGVSTVLEGSVRKADDRVRVTAQLVSAEDGFHLWSESYDYRLDDVFKVQGEIARSVVKALKGTLLGEDVAATASIRATNTEAHTAFLRGRYEIHRRRKDSILRSEEFFQDAVRADPSYAPAWVGLAESYMLQHINHDVLTLEEAEAKAEQAIQHALELDDRASEAYAALGLMRMEANRLEEAEAAFSRSLALNPNYPEALHWYGLLDRRLGRTELARQKLKRAVDLDPLHPVARSNLGQVLLDQGAYDEARDFFERGVTLDPDYAPNYAILGGIAVLGPLPRPAEGLAYIEQALTLEPDSPDYANYRVTILLEMDRLEAARQAAAEFRAREREHPLATLAQLAIHLYTGDDEGAAGFLDEEVALKGEALGPFAHLFTAIAQLLRDQYTEAVQSFGAFDARLVAEPPELDITNLGISRLLALSYIEIGDRERAEQIMDAAEAMIAKIQRFGPQGYRLLDADMALLRGDPDEAIARLQQAYDVGYRSRTIDGLWPLSGYPLFEELQDRPEFQRLVARIESYHR